MRIADKLLKNKEFFKWKGWNLFHLPNTDSHSSAPYRSTNGNGPSQTKNGHKVISYRTANKKSYHHEQFGVPDDWKCMTRLGTARKILNYRLIPKLIVLCFKRVSKLHLFFKILMKKSLRQRDFLTGLVFFKAFFTIMCNFRKSECFRQEKKTVLQIIWKIPSGFMRSWCRLPISGSGSGPWIWLINFLTRFCLR